MAYYGFYRENELRRLQLTEDDLFDREEAAADWDFHYIWNPLLRDRVADDEEAVGTLYQEGHFFGKVVTRDIIDGFQEMLTGEEEPFDRMNFAASDFRSLDTFGRMMNVVADNQLTKVLEFDFLPADFIQLLLTECFPRGSLKRLSMEWRPLDESEKDILDVLETLQQISNKGVSLPEIEIRLYLNTQDATICRTIRRTDVVTILHVSPFNGPCDQVAYESLCHVLNTPNLQQLCLWSPRFVPPSLSMKQDLFVAFMQSRLQTVRIIGHSRATQLPMTLIEPLFVALSRGSRLRGLFLELATPLATTLLGLLIRQLPYWNHLRSLTLPRGSYQGLVEAFQQQQNQSTRLHHFDVVESYSRERTNNAQQDEILEPCRCIAKSRYQTYLDSVIQQVKLFCLDGNPTLAQVYGVWNSALIWSEQEWLQLGHESNMVSETLWSLQTVLVRYGLPSATMEQTKRGNHSLRQSS